MEHTHSIGCSVAGCVREVVVKGMCRTCYRREWSRARRPVRPPRPTVEERFWAHVNKNGPMMPGMSEACWVWTGTTRSDGYGVMCASGRSNIRTHRLAYELAHGDPGDLFVLHACDNPPCCNPAHLRAGTSADNMREMGDRKRSKFHKWTPRGTEHGRSKLTDADVIEMRRMRREDDAPYDKIAVAFGLTRSGAFDVVTGAAWGHLPGAVPSGAGPRRSFSDEDIALMREMRRGGATLKQVAAAFGTSVTYACGLTTGNVGHVQRAPAQTR